MSGPGSPPVQPPVTMRSGTMGFLATVFQPGKTGVVPLGRGCQSGFSIPDFDIFIFPGEEGVGAMPMTTRGCPFGQFGQFAATDVTLRGLVISVEAPPVIATWNNWVWPALAVLSPIGWSGSSQARGPGSSWSQPPRS